eukprot:EC122811.1.p1 GENE.EC122811.1~~EC122811.1.p1  ORF type:complete len:165 (+),score=5.80 EC122811.1:58-552(+)
MFRMGSRGRSQTIFVGGLSIYTRAKEVAYAFEKFGPLVRCDIPTPGGRSRGYAFVEFEDYKDAEDAFEAMQYKRIDGREISLQWAKRRPASGWRSPKRRSRSPRRSSRSRSRSPRRSRSGSRSSPSKKRSRRGSRSPSRSPHRRDTRDSRRSSRSRSKSPRRSP